MTTAKGPSRLRFMGGAALLIVLVAGGLSGAAINRAMTTRERPTRERDECERFRQDDTRRRSHGPYDFLNLSTEQKEQMDAVLEKRKTQLDDFWKEHRPRMDSIVEGARAELREILTPEQQAENDMRNERRREEWRALEQRCMEQLRLEQEQEQGRGNSPPQGRRNGPAQGRQERPRGPGQPELGIQPRVDGYQA